LEGIKQNKSLIKLDVSSNALGPNCGKVLRQKLQETSLEELNISDVDL